MHNNNHNNQRRQRPRGHQGGHSSHGGNRRPSNNSGTYSRNQTFDSNGPDVRVRGTAQQVYEKYVNTAHDVARNDPIRAENLLQHAEHYFRIVGSIQENMQQTQNEPRYEQQPRIDNFPAPQDGMEQPFAPIQQAPMQRQPQRQRGGYVPPAPAPMDSQPSLGDMPAFLTGGETGNFAPPQFDSPPEPRQSRPRGGYVPPAPQKSPEENAEDNSDRAAI